MDIYAIFKEKLAPESFNNPLIHGHLGCFPLFSMVKKYILQLPLKGLHFNHSCKVTFQLSKLKVNGRAKMKVKGGPEG